MERTYFRLDSPTDDQKFTVPNNIFSEHTRISTLFPEKTKTFILHFFQHFTEKRH